MYFRLRTLWVKVGGALADGQKRQPDPGPYWELGYDYGVLQLRIKNIDKDECPYFGQVPLR